MPDKQNPHIVLEDLGNSKPPFTLNAAVLLPAGTRELQGKPRNPISPPSEKGNRRHVNATLRSAGGL